jgi:hypothetical protein
MGYHLPQHVSDDDIKGHTADIEKCLARDDLPPEVRSLLGSTIMLLCAIVDGWDALDDDTIIAFQDGEYVRRAAKRIHREDADAVEVWRRERAAVLERVRIVAENEAEARALGYPNLISMQSEIAGEQHPEIMYGGRRE